VRESLGLSEIEANYSSVLGQPPVPSGADDGAAAQRLRERHLLLGASPGRAPSAPTS
jgi:hypothetical protein